MSKTAVLKNGIGSLSRMSVGCNLPRLAFASQGFRIRRKVFEERLLVISKVSVSQSKIEVRVASKDLVKSGPPVAADVPILSFVDDLDTA